jgi:hypothetical protein
MRTSIPLSGRLARDGDSSPQHREQASREPGPELSLVEHNNNAEKQGRAAARSMLDSTTPYGYIHSFWSDQPEHTLEYVGHATTWDEFVVRGSLQERKLVGFYLQDGLLRAAVGLDRGGDPELDLTRRWRHAHAW